MSDTMVYVIAPKQDGKLVAPSKIGVANFPYGRLASLQTGSPQELDVHAYIRLPSRAAAHTVERWFHEDNQERRIRGEWFDVEPMAATRDLVYQLRNYLRQQFPDPDAYEDMLDWCVNAMSGDE